MRGSKTASANIEALAETGKDRIPRERASQRGGNLGRGRGMMMRASSPRLLPSMAAAVHRLSKAVAATDPHAEPFLSQQRLIRQIISLGSLWMLYIDDIIVVFFNVGVWYSGITFLSHSCD